MSSTDLVVVGAGIVGLATTWAIIKQRPKTQILLIEKEEEIGAHQSSHNSGVLHSGVYYKPGSLKSKNCQSGYGKMLEFCQSREIPIEVCGKVIVATEASELERLQNIFERGRQNGLEGLKWLEADELKEHEPHVAGINAIYVPQAGIVNYKSVMIQIKKELIAAGVEILCSEKVGKIAHHEKGVSVETEKRTYNCEYIITTGGVYSDRLAKELKPDLDFRIVPFRGEYYNIKPERTSLVKNLIYPVPNPEFPFLGVHLTRMIEGGVETGPNAVLALSREGYSWTDISPKDLFESLSWPGFQKIAARHFLYGIGEVYRSLSKGAFTKALQRLLPELKKEDLIPGKRGVRAQACSKNGLVDDFWIERGPRFLLVLNAPSPAATSSFAIGESLAEHYFQNH